MGEDKGCNQLDVGKETLGNEPQDTNAKTEPQPIAASFSIGHALSVIRRRQEEQRRAKEEEEKKLEEERKEKAKEKRRRRRRNQKERNRQLRADAQNDRPGDEPGSVVSQPNTVQEECSSSDSNPETESCLETDQVAQLCPTQSNANLNGMAATIDISGLPLKKRPRLENQHEDTATHRNDVASPSATNKPSKLSFIPRALLIKKKAKP